MKKQLLRPISNKSLSRLQKDKNVHKEINSLVIPGSSASFREKFVVWTVLDTDLRLSEFADLEKDNIQWQERRLVIYDKGGPYGKKTKRRIIPTTDRVRRLMVYYFAENNAIGTTKRTVARIVKKVAELEKERILKALNEAGWVQVRAARLLGISRRILRYKMGKYGIERE